MLRAPLASTFATTAPASAAARSRRTVSTSGSSGKRLGGRPGPHHLAQRLPRLPGGALLGLLLGPPLAPAAHHPGDRHGCEEPLGVVRAVVDDLVARQLVEVPGGELLQPRLVVLAAGTGRRPLDPLAQQAHDQV